MSSKQLVPITPIIMLTKVKLVSPFERLYFSGHVTGTLHMFSFFELKSLGHLRVVCLCYRLCSLSGTDHVTLAVTRDKTKRQQGKRMFCRRGSRARVWRQYGRDSNI